MNEHFPLPNEGERHAELDAEDLAKVERSDGSRSVEVVARFQGCTHVVKHFDNPRAGKPRAGSLLVLALGLCLAAGGVVAFGSQVYSVKRQEAHQAKTKAFIQERGLPAKFVPRIRTNRTAEVLGASCFALGLFGLLLGGLRTRDDLRKPSFTVGEHPRCTYNTPTDSLPAGQPEFPLVRSEEGAFLLAFTPRMDGVVSLPDGRTLTLKDLVQVGLAQPSPTLDGAYDLRVDDGIEARLSFGASSFTVSTVATAKAIAGPGIPRTVAGVASRPISLATMGSGAVASLLMLLFSFRPAEAGAFDADSVQSGRISKMLRSELKSARKEEKARQEKRPRPRPTAAPRSNEKGRGGERDDRRNSHMGAGPSSNTTGSNRPSAAKSSGIGMVGVLQSATQKLGSMFSRNAITSDAEDALGALVGISVGDDSGIDGLGLNNGGRGGSGNGAGVVGPGGWNTCKAGLCGGSGWDGPGGTIGIPKGGRSVGAYRPKGPVVFDSGATISNCIDKRTIKRIIRRHLSQVKYCYVTFGLASNPSLQGSYKVGFTINARGRVARVFSLGGNLRHPRTEACIRSMIRTWRFPKIAGRIPTVIYPFHFRPSGR